MNAANDTTRCNVHVIAAVAKSLGFRGASFTAGSARCVLTVSRAAKVAFAAQLAGWTLVASGEGATVRQYKSESFALSLVAREDGFSVCVQAVGW